MTDLKAGGKPRDKRAPLPAPPVGEGPVAPDGWVVGEAVRVLRLRTDTLERAQVIAVGPDGVTLRLLTWLAPGTWETK